MGRSASFNSFDLQGVPFRMISTDAFSAPEKEIIKEELARSDNAVAVFRRYKSREINLSGLIVDSSSDLVDTDIDLIKLKVMFAQKSNLDIGWAGGFRRWGAECKNLIITRSNTDVSRAGYDVQFFCEEAFATDGTSSDLLGASTVTITDNGFIYFSAQGTALAMPVFQLTINSITAGPIDIIIGNPASGEYITIAGRSYIAGDVLTIDTHAKKIFHNATQLPGSGYFPAWPPGSGSFEYSDSAAARNISVASPYDKRYL